MIYFLTNGLTDIINQNFSQRHLCYQMFATKMHIETKFSDKKPDIPFLSKNMEFLNKWVGGDFEPNRQRQFGSFQGSFLFLSRTLIFFSNKKNPRLFQHKRFCVGQPENV